MRCLQWLAHACGLLFMVAGAPVAAEPTVFHVSDPILPSQTALLFGDGIGKDVRVSGVRVADEAVVPEQRQSEVTGALQALTVLQASDISAKVVIPAEWRPGLYALRLTNRQGQSHTVYLNRTEPWWWIGGSADATRAAPGDIALGGEVIRVFGSNFGPQTRAWLAIRQQYIALETVKAEKYAAAFRLPPNIEPGEYALWVHNGFGGAHGFGSPLQVKVGKPAPWPAQQYNVRDFGAQGDYVTDDTPAFLAAIAKAAQNSGGIVYIPRGRYKITGKLSLPPHTVLRGENRELVWLFVPKESPEFDAVIAGNHDFAVESLSIVAQTVHRLIVCPDDPRMSEHLGGAYPPRVPGSNVHLFHLRLQLLRYAHRIQKNDPRRQEDAGPSTLSLHGADMWLNDLIITSSGMPFDIHDARRCRVENSNLATGRNGWYGLWNCSEGIFEGNDVHAADLEGSYGGVQQNANHLYIANNIWHDAYGGEREALSFDSPYYSTWLGTPAEVHARTLTAPGQQWMPNSLLGMACVVVNGKGLGQYLPIVDNTADTITLAREWTVPLDQSSVVSIQANKTRVVIFNNRMSDASVAVQLYSQCYGFIIDSNQAERTGGFYGNGWDFYAGTVSKRRYSCCYFNQWLNNQVTQGFVYDQGRIHGAIIGPRIDITGLEKPLSPSHAIMAIGNIMRGNKARDQVTLGEFFFQPVAANKRLDVDYVGRDTVIEDNTISDSDVGINIARFYVDTLIRSNHIDRCKMPIVDQGTGTLVR